MSGPVYVVGLERSGTSLLYALLASHPDIAMFRRSNLWRYFYGQYGDLEEDGNLARCLEIMARYKRLTVLEIDFQALRTEFVSGPRTYGRLFDLVGRQVADRAGRPRWGDKSLKTEEKALEIFEALPDARIIHMVRDPRDRFASSRSRWDVLRGGVGAGAAEWNLSARLALANQSKWDGRYMILRYEDLVSDPRSALRRVCQFLDEEFDEQMFSMDGAASFREQGSNSSYGPREAGKISTDSIGMYHQILATHEVGFMNRACRNLMRHLGYEPIADRVGLLDRARFLGLAVPLESARYLAWSVRSVVQRRRGESVPPYRLVDPANA